LLVVDLSKSVEPFDVVIRFMFQVAANPSQR
jgi:hypothetical protein